MTGNRPEVTRYSIYGLCSNRKQPGNDCILFLRARVRPEVSSYCPFIAYTGANWGRFSLHTSAVLGDYWCFGYILLRWRALGVCGANKASGVGVWRAKRAAGGWAAGRPRIVAEGDVLRVLCRKTRVAVCGGKVADVYSRNVAFMMRLH